MKARNLYPWPPFVAASLAVAALTVSRWLTPRPAPPPEPVQARSSDIPSWVKPDYLALRLRDTAPDLRVIYPARFAYCYVIAPDVDPAALGAVPDTEEYADCWRGVVLCEADWAVTHPDEAALPDGPHARRAGDFRLFGDVNLLERVRTAAEMIHFGPYRGAP